MNKRQREAKEKWTKWMEDRSEERTKKLRFKKDKDLNIDLGIAGMELPALPSSRPKELKWRKYLNTRRTHLKRTKRILVVEEIVKKKEVYTISGLNKSEINKVIEAIARK